MGISAMVARIDSFLLSMTRSDAVAGKLEAVSMRVAELGFAGSKVISLVPSSKP